MTELAFAALAILLYTYAGYPLLVAVWARLLPRSVTKHADFEPAVSVCLAVHDGERHVARKLESLLALDYPREKLEILVYSDGSRDATERIAREYQARDPRVVVLASRERRGKPAALNRLRERASGEVLLMTDVRQALTPNALRALLAPLADERVGCVSGVLVLSGESGASAYWRYERFIRGSEARLGRMVGVSGSLYAIRRADFPELPEDVLLDDMFVPLRLSFANKHVVLSEDARAFDEACDDEREFSRKVRTLAGNYQLVAKLPALLVPGKNPVWFQMVSHKLLRLLCPWALVALFVSSCWLALDAGVPPGWAAFFGSLALAQIAFYGLALLGPRAGRLGRLARTFVVLNAAALVGLFRYLRRSQAVTW